MNPIPPQSRHYWQTRYDQAAQAATEDWRTGCWKSPHYYHIVQDRFLRATATLPKPPSHILDLCCGTGAFAALLQQQGHHVTAMDISLGAIKRLRQHPQRASIPILNADAEHLPFPAARFDAILAIGMLQCIDDPAPYFEGLARILRPGGQLILLFSPDAWLIRRRKRQSAQTGNPDMAHYRLHSLSRIYQHLTCAGFHPITHTHLYYLFYNPLVRPFLRLINRHAHRFPALTPFATNTLITATKENRIA